MSRSDSELSSPHPSQVSVVTVNWNGLRHLEELMPSLEECGCGEVIVVDNGSEDGSKQFLRRRYPRVKLVENRINRGFAQPCNQGAEAASLPYVAFINNDMRVDSQWLQQSLAKLGPDTPCAACRILDWEGERIDFNGSSLQYLGFALQEDIGRLADEVSAQDEVLFPCGGAMLVRRSVFLELEGFDPDYFAIFEDVDFGWRLWVSGYRVAFAPRSLVYHRGHGTFTRHANQRMRYLMHRNALLTVLKNYQEEVFQRVLPLAVRLAIRRAVLLTGVEKESFYLWAQSRHELRSGDRAAQERWIDALNHLVALDDVLESLPKWMEKRRRVQQRRRREDAEIVKLFGDPLRRIVEDPRYEVEERSWLRLLSLDRFLPLDESPDPRPREADRLSHQIADLRAQIDDLQRLGAQALKTPPAPRRPGLRAALASLRREGLRVTLERVARRLRRGY
ncbi:MAG TPA: glycosyltransferase family 2 protein [Acidobacteriota bacterium]|nr:glycosyltransferase family 2 protein [Acidobacteriota bacterium]